MNLNGRDVQIHNKLKEVGSFKNDTTDMGVHYPTLFFGAHIDCREGKSDISKNAY